MCKGVKKELTKNYDKFIVKIIQVFYNDNYEIYQNLKEDIITDKVCVQIIITSNNVHNMDIERKKELKKLQELNNNDIKEEKKDVLMEWIKTK